MKRKIITHLFVLLAVFAFLFSPLAAHVAYAHGEVEVGDYEIEIGWHVEPAYQGEVNGMEFFVTNATTGEPVNGLEDTLRLEITYGAATRELTVETQWGAEGAYIGYAVPTAAGDYTAHLWGDIEGTPVDISMTSGPDTFGSIEPKANIAFPVADPTASELKAHAQTATTIGIIGIVLGLVGTTTGVMALRKKK